jgi:mediator of RNA polymerase II transcription subunit 12
VLILAAPPQTRPTLYTAFLGEISSAAIQTAFDRYPGLLSSLPQTSPVRRPISLQTADATETTPLDDRPWEMFEQLVPTAKTVKHVDMFLSSRPIRDTASIPITLFKPQLKRDPLPHAHVAQGDNDWETSVAERNLGDGLAGEPLGLKQAATLLFAQPKSDPSPESSEDETTSVAHTHTRTRTETSKKSSPITAMTPLTTLTPANRPRRSSTRAGTSTKDAIALDDSSSDSDLEIVAEPPPKRARVGSKSTTTTAAERPTTSGKAPAKRTTGGKGVPRKGTGGKNVARKAPAGKAPKKR